MNTEIRWRGRRTPFANAQFTHAGMLFADNKYAPRVAWFRGLVDSSNEPVEIHNMCGEVSSKSNFSFDISKHVLSTSPDASFEQNVAVEIQNSVDWSKTLGPNLPAFNPVSVTLFDWKPQQGLSTQRVDSKSDVVIYVARGDCRLTLHGVSEDEADLKVWLDQGEGLVLRSAIEFSSVAGSRDICERLEVRSRLTSDGVLEEYNVVNTSKVKRTRCVLLVCRQVPLAEAVTEEGPFYKRNKVNMIPPLITMDSSASTSSSSSSSKSAPLSSMSPSLETAADGAPDGKQAMTFMRHFLIPCHQGPVCAEDVHPHSLVQHRCDLICHCTSAAILTSFGTRMNTRLTCVMQDRTSITWDGAAVRHLRPEEHILGTILRSALEMGPLTAEAAESLRAEQKKYKCTKGVSVSLSTFAQALYSAAAPYSKPNSIVLVELHEDGLPAMPWFRSADAKILREAECVLVVAGDNKDVHPDERDTMHAWARDCEMVHQDVVCLCLGKQSLFASQCITVLHHYFDLFNEGQFN